jgi:predicted dehydrogenase
VDYILQTVTLLGGNLLKRASSTDFDFNRIVEEYRATDKVEFGIVKEEPLKAQLGAFYAFARGEPSEICTAEDGLRALRLAHDAIQTGVRGVSVD